MKAYSLESSSKIYRHNDVFVISVVCITVNIEEWSSVITKCQRFTYQTHTVNRTLQIVLCKLPVLAQKLHNENCVRDISANKEIYSVKHAKLCRFIEKHYSVCPCCWTTHSSQPLIDGAVHEALRQFAPLRDDCTLDLLDCSESSPA